MFWCSHAFGHPPDASDVPIFSNTPLYVFRCRNLALIFFSGMYVLHLGGMLTPLYILMPPCIQMPTQCPLVCPPMLPSASACSGGIWIGMVDVGTFLLFGHPHVLDAFTSVQNLYIFICCHACLSFKTTTPSQSRKLLKLLLSTPALPPQSRNC